MAVEGGSGRRKKREVVDIEGFFFYILSMSPLSSPEFVTNLLPYPCSYIKCTLYMYVCIVHMYNVTPSRNAPLRVDFFFYALTITLANH